MIIKKKYTVQNITEEVKQEEQENPVVESSAKEEKRIENEIIDDSEKKSEEEKEKKNIKNLDLDLTLENIKFEQREERREGSRRRGYRRTQDRNIVSRAQKEAISIKEIAKKEGYEEGIANAKKDLELLNSKFAEFFKYKDEAVSKVAECINDVAVEIAKKIINKQIEIDKEYILTMIKGVVEEVNKAENKITLKVMPKDVEIVRDNIKEVFEGNYFEAKISVVPDNTIKDGGVIVETSNGLIDATVETQLSIMTKALKKQDEG